MAGDGGAWLREQSLVLAQNNHTGVPFWLDLPLCAWAGWIRANNNVVRRGEQVRTPPPVNRMGTGQGGGMAWSL